MSLVFGRDELPRTDLQRADEWTEVGWHPECGHVLHMAIGPTLEMPYSPTLVYGRIRRSEAVARLESCAICRPPEQSGLGL